MFSKERNIGNRMKSLHETRAKRSKNDHHEIPEIGAYTRFPRRPRLTPRPKAGQSLQGAQIAARGRSNDAFRAPEPNFRTFREKSVKIPQKREGTDRKEN